jgi:AAA domain-containing protein
MSEPQSVLPAATIPAEGFLDEFIFCPDDAAPPEESIFSGFLYRGVLVAWIGREKHRKTNHLLQLAVCAAVGRSYLTFAFAYSAPLRVVFIDYESRTRKLKERYDSICQALGLSDDQRLLLKANLSIIEVRRLYKKGQSFHRFPVKPGENSEAEVFWKKFTTDYPADVYIFDPMRCVHGQDENDSNIERLLTRLRQFFPDSIVIVSHHMRKAGMNLGLGAVALKDDMRLWSDGARGSGAIKAHADVIVCQERKIEAQSEVVYWGAFQRDEADIEPMHLEESKPGSFLWRVAPQVPEHLKTSFDALKKAGGRFTEKVDAAKALMGVGVKKATAYRHLSDLANHGFFANGDGQWILRDPERGPT